MARKVYRKRKGGSLFGSLGKLGKSLYKNVVKPIAKPLVNQALKQGQQALVMGAQSRMAPLLMAGAGRRRKRGGAAKKKGVPNPRPRVASNRMGR